MLEIEQYTGLRHPLASILITLALVLIGFQLIGPMIGMAIAFPFYPGTAQQFAAAMADPFSHPEFKESLLLMQGCGTAFGMIAIPYFFLNLQRRSFVRLFDAYWYPGPVFMVIVLVIVFMGVNSLFIEWNQKISFPGDEWARQIEETLAKGTRYLTQFNSVSDLVIVFIVVAVLPAIGEELVFRGIIQNELYRGTRNIHLSIWVSAILFSAIHVQFFGFIPRMLLGALFGYLYFWSGNLWLAVLAHFVNNGFTVIGLYMYQKGMIDIDLEATNSTPWPMVVVSAALSGLLLYRFKMFYNSAAKTDIPD